MSVDIPEDKAESYVRGTKVVPVAVVRPQAWGEGADVTFYCDDESHVYQPTPEEIAETEAYLRRKATLNAMGVRIAEFAKSAYPKSQPRASRSCASGHTRPSRPATSANPTTPGKASRSGAARRSTSSS